MLLPLWIFFMWPPVVAVNTPEPFVVKEEAEQEVIRADAEIFLTRGE